METYTYTIRCKLGGEMVLGNDEFEGDADTVEEARGQAQDRLVEEVTELALRGSNEEWDATFQVVDGNPVREAWDALGAALLEKDGWREAMEQAYELLQVALGIEDVTEEGT